MSTRLQEGSILHDRFVFGKVIGSGGYGSVFRGFDLMEAREVAVKVSYGIDVRKKRNTNEAKILEMLKMAGSPFSDIVVQLVTWFEEEDCVILVLEHMPGNLRKSIQEGACNGLFEVSLYGEQIILFLLSMTRLSVIHGDIKPENILIDESTHSIRFVDFGMSSSPQLGTKPKLIQTSDYRAPEVLLRHAYDQSADTWSAACVLVECLFGYRLFYANDDLELMQKIVRMVGMPPDDYLILAPRRDEFFYYSHEHNRWLVKGVDKILAPEGIRNFIRRQCRGNIDTTACLEFVEVVEGMLQFYPPNRCTPDVCLKFPFFSSKNRASYKKQKISSWVPLKSKAVKCVNSF